MNPLEPARALLENAVQGVAGQPQGATGEESPTMMCALRDLISDDDGHERCPLGLVSDLSALIELESDWLVPTWTRLYDSLNDALSRAGVPETRRAHVWETLAASLYLERLDLYDMETLDGVDTLCVDQTSDALRAFCLLMGCSMEKFQTALTCRNVRSGRRSGHKGTVQSKFFETWRDTYKVPESFQMPLKRDEAETRKLLLMRALHNCVFNYVAFIAHASSHDASRDGDFTNLSNANIAIFDDLLAQTPLEPEPGSSTLGKIWARFNDEAARKTTMKKTAVQFTIRHHANRTSYHEDEFACGRAFPDDLSTFLEGVANPFIHECERLKLTSWCPTSPKSTRAPFSDALCRLRQDDNQAGRCGCLSYTRNLPTSSEGEQWDVMAELQVEIGNDEIRGDSVERQPISFDMLVDTLVQEQKNGGDCTTDGPITLSEEYLSAVLDEVLQEGDIEKVDPLCKRERCSLHEEVEDVLSKQSAALCKHTAKLADAQRRGQELRDENERLQQVAAQFEKTVPQRIKKREKLKKILASGFPSAHTDNSSNSKRSFRGKRLSPLKLWQR